MRLLCFLLTGLTFTLMACGDDNDNNSTPAVQLPEGCDHFITPSDDDQESVQLALIEAEPGQTICLDAGEFIFNAELSTSVNGLTIRGQGMNETILNFAIQDLGGNGLHVTSDGVVLEDFQVLDTPGDDIRVSQADGITFRRIGAIWSNPASSENGGYGLYPVRSQRVLIEDCVATGASDSGIYVGQSSKILLRGNEVYGNVAGMEIENSFESEAVDNHAYENSVGIFILSLPGLYLQHGSGAKIHNNISENNNLPNFADPGNFIYNAPGGTGLLILASDNTEITENTFRNNGSGAVIIASYLDDYLGARADTPGRCGGEADAASCGEEDDCEDGSACEDFRPPFQRFPEETYVHNNTYEGNGMYPQGFVDLLETHRLGRCGGGGDRNCHNDDECEGDLTCEGYEPAPQIIWDGCLHAMPGEPLCIQEGEEIKMRAMGFDLCYGDGAHVNTTAIEEYDCAYEPLPTQNPANW